MWPPAAVSGQTQHEDKPQGRHFFFRGERVGEQSKTLQYREGQRPVCSPSSGRLPSLQQKKSQSVCRGRWGLVATCGAKKVLLCVSFKLDSTYHPFMTPVGGTEGLHAFTGALQSPAASVGSLGLAAGVSLTATKYHLPYTGIDYVQLWRAGWFYLSHWGLLVCTVACTFAGQALKMETITLTSSDSHNMEALAALAVLSK